MLPRWDRRFLSACSIVATALAISFSASASAQTMEQRAHTAADASRAKTSDSDALQQNYVTPGLAGQQISTVDNSRTFAPNIACQKTATMLEVVDRKSTRLNSVTNAHLVCRLLLEKKTKINNR